MMEPLKVCSKCKVPKALSNFDANKSKRDGKSERCKECRFKHRRVPKVKAQQAVYKARNKRRQAEKLRGNPIKCELTSNQVAFVLNEGSCGYCQKPLTYSEATVDHIIPHARGGSNTFDNVISACSRCNSSKVDTPALLFMLQNCEPYANKKLLERLALRSGESVSDVYAGLVADTQVYYEQQAVASSG
jgi:5-methylcytosine-specific restriction endonuclease McrA